MNRTMMLILLAPAPPFVRFSRLTVNSLTTPPPATPPLSLLCSVGFGDEAIVEKGGEHGAYYRAHYVDPDGGELPGYDHRPQGTRRVQRPPGYGPGNKHSAGQREANRQGRHTRPGPPVGGH